MRAPWLQRAVHTGVRTCQQRLTLIVERTLWTDERVTDAMTRIDQRFDAVDRRFDAVDRRFDAIDRRFDGIHNELREIRTTVGALQRQFAQVGWALATAVFLQTIALVVTTALR